MMPQDEVDSHASSPLGRPIEEPKNEPQEVLPEELEYTRLHVLNPYGPRHQKEEGHSLIGMLRQTIHRANEDPGGFFRQRKGDTV